MSRMCVLRCKEGPRGTLMTSRQARQSGDGLRENRMSQAWKITVIVFAAAGVLSTPLIWLLDSPGAGQLVGATVQAAAGIAALVWAVFQRGSAVGPTDRATRTGKASHGGTTGIRRPGGRGRGRGARRGRRQGQ